MRAFSLPWLLVAIALAAACGHRDPPTVPTLIDLPLSELPPLLSGTGLFLDVRDPSRVDERAVASAPQYALWSNGSDKQRHIVLPEGETITQTVAGFVFPEGTLVYKSFAFADADQADGMFYAELRVMRLGGEGWEFAAYRYDDDRQDGVLLEGRRAEAVEVPDSDGDAFEHSVPSTRQCRTCHESSPVEVLGFSALQLDYDDGDGNVLSRLEDAGLFQDPVEHVARIDSGDEETDWVLGYVVGNCAHCHNGFTDLANSSFDLRPEVFLEQTIDRDTESSGSGIGTRIVAGSADDSVLYLAFTGRDNDTGIEAMPPLGVQLRDTAAAERLGAWIEGLED
jgi:hypothetical protein